MKHSITLKWVFFKLNIGHCYNLFSKFIDGKRYIFNKLCGRKLCQTLKRINRAVVYLSTS